MMPINAKTFGIAITISVVAIVLGGTFGTLSVPDHSIDVKRVTKTATTGADEEEIVDHRARFHVSLHAPAIPEIVRQQVLMARNAGVTGFTFEIDLPRNEEDRLVLTETLDNLFESETDDTFWLSVNCNPPAAWYTEHPDEVVTSLDNTVQQPSITSSVWLAETKTLLIEMMRSQETMLGRGTLEGITLKALHKGRWAQLDNQDTTSKSLDDFQLWLQARYLSIDRIKDVWGEGTPDAWEAIQVPNPPETASVYFDPTADAATIDFNRFLSDATADTINELAASIHSASSVDIDVFTTAGDIFMDTRGGSGLWLHDKLDTNFLSGLSTQSPAISLPGMPSTPPITGMQILHVDPVFTGIEYNSVIGEVSVPPNYDRSIPVQNLTRDAMISVNSNGIWSIVDPQGQGRFSYEPIWRDIQSLLGVRTEALTLNEDSNAPPITLVIDTDSGAYINDGDFTRQIILDTIRALNGSGLPYTWKTLNEIGGAPDNSEPTYLFLSSIHVDTNERTMLHEALIRQKATAVWFYASGLIDDTTASTENVSRTTGVQVEGRESESALGSKFAFTGTWIEESVAYSESRTGISTYHVIDEDADPLARYSDNDEISAAIKFLDAGWTSIVLLDPGITPGFLKDLVYILGTPIDVVSHVVSGDPSIIRDGQTLTIFSEDEAEIRLEFAAPANVTNLMDQSEGWHNRTAVGINLKPGEIKVLHFQIVSSTP